MSEPSLRELESEVVAARARLARDLATLRSPATVSQFKDEVTNQAVSVKDALIEKARTEASVRVSDFIDDIKARAAANPAAVLAIGAGIAWRLLRRPPITTALVGAGLVSLLRTSPGERTHRSDTEYLDHAKRRLREQASDAASGIGEQARGMAAKATEKVQHWSSETGAQLQETASDLMDTARVKAAQLSDRTSDRLQAGAAHASERMSASWQSAREGVAHSASEVRRTASGLQTSLGQEEVTDRLLLGAAGVAVAAALGIACQRRLSNPELVD